MWSTMHSLRLKVYSLLRSSRRGKGTLTMPEFSSNCEAACHRTCAGDHLIACAVQGEWRSQFQSLVSDNAVLTVRTGDCPPRASRPRAWPRASRVSLHLRLQVLSAWVLSAPHPAVHTLPKDLFDKLEKAAVAHPSQCIVNMSENWGLGFNVFDDHLH